MAILPPKLRSLLTYLKELEHASAGEREKAAYLLAGSMDDKKLIIIRRKKDAGDATDVIAAARARLEDIHRRLDLTIKCGQLSETIH